MKNNYILIDYENVQPKSLSVLNGHPFKVMLFLGSNQTKIPVELASEMQALGANAEYVQIDGNGPNALDFHISFYAGQIATRDPNCYIHFISKDTGFDPLVKHLKSKKVLAQRLKSVTDVSILKISNAKPVDEKIEAITKNLDARGTSKPRKVKTLTSTINALFSKNLGETELMDLIAELHKQDFIAIDGQNVTYPARKVPR